MKREGRTGKHEIRETTHTIRVPRNYLHASSRKRACRQACCRRGCPVSLTACSQTRKTRTVEILASERCVEPIFQNCKDTCDVSMATRFCVDIFCYPLVRCFASCTGQLPHPLGTITRFSPEQMQWDARSLWKKCGSLNWQDGQIRGRNLCGKMGPKLRSCACLSRFGPDLAVSAGSLGMSAAAWQTRFPFHACREASDPQCAN